MNKIFLTLFVIAALLTGCSMPGETGVTSPTNDAAVNPVDVIVEEGATPSQSQPAGTESSSQTYSIVDTGQTACYDNSGQIPCASSGSAFGGQDGNYQGATPAYTDNGDGTVTDLNTGLMWQKDPGEKMTYEQAEAGAASLNLGGYTDWRLPTIKELYSLILFDGRDVSGCNGTCSVVPFIDTRYFDFSYGDTNSGERVIDSQFATSTKYVSTTMNGADTMFGVNFADGRIKGYGTGPMPGQSTGKLFYVLYVRGNSNYGINSFVDNGNDTIADLSTGLIWMKSDSGTGVDWSGALAYCEANSTAGYNDWRLPNAKELQSIVDYSRSPATTNSAAIDPVFYSTPLTAETGSADFPFYWTSTTHVASNGSGNFAVYISFGSAYGYMSAPNSNAKQLMDVHGAGAQRSDPKTGNASEYPEGHGPQGDVVRINNYVRCVRGEKTTYATGGSQVSDRPSQSLQSGGIQDGQGQPQMSGGSQGQGKQGPTGGTPPQEAIAACANLTQGSACTVNTPNGTVSGTCGTPPNSSQLACMPAGGPQQP
jgi:hypothetical protein